MKKHWADSEGESIVSIVHNQNTGVVHGSQFTLHGSQLLMGNRMAQPSKPPFLDDHPSGFILNIYVQPKSSKNMIVGPHGDYLKIKLTAPPVDNAANKMCLDFLSKFFKVPKSDMGILSGHTGRNKRLQIKADTAKTKTRIRQQLQKYWQ